MKTLSLTLDADGIALVTIDVPGHGVNVINPDFIADLDALIGRLASDDAVRGAVLRSGKAGSFMAGLDLNHLDTLLPPDASLAETYRRVCTLNDLFRRLECCGKPIVAAIEGLALGGGLALALACHHRVLADDPAVQIGLPEVKLGLFPGAGGSQRLPRLIGVQAALLIMLQGRNLRPAEALATKIVDTLAAAGEAVAAGRTWILANPQGHLQPWDRPGFKVPGGAGPFSPSFVQTMMAATAMTSRETQRNIHAPHALLSVVYEGIQLPFDRALRVESQYFARTIADPQVRAMVRTLFIAKTQAERGVRRPAGVARAPTQRLALLGAGMMGAGIANVAAQAGIEVVLLDRDLATAEGGKAEAAKAMAKRIGRGLTPDQMAAALARITPTAHYEAIRACDFVIEAVFEDPAIKAETIRKAQAVLGPDVIIGSNTSTLPISDLAASSSSPAQFIGIHFFSPVERMALVEIIMGKETGSAALAKALDFVAQIRKTPIVVNDARGFYTSRCFATYVQEGALMLAEGVNPALIENMGRQLGMPVGPLAVADEISIELADKVTRANKAALGAAYRGTRADDVAAQMVAIGRLGRKSGAGYYDYPDDGGRKSLWPGLAGLYPRAAIQPAPEQVRERLLYRQLVECARCLAEGVLTSPQDGDLGAVFGWGFAPHLGGPLSSIDIIGPAQVVGTLDRLTAEHGERFAAPNSLRDMAASGRRYFGEPRPNLP